MESLNKAKEVLCADEGCIYEGRWLNQSSISLVQEKYNSIPFFIALQVANLAEK